MCSSCLSDIILNTDLWMGRFIPSLNCCWILTFVYWAKLGLCFLEQLTKLPHISEHLSIFLPSSNMNCYTALCWGPHSSCQSLLNTFPRVNTGANKKRRLSHYKASWKMANFPRKKRTRHWRKKIRFSPSTRLLRLTEIRIWKSG